MNSIHFSVRKDKSDKYGRCPIQLAYYRNEQRAYFRIGYSVIPTAWDSENEKPVYFKKAEAKKAAPGVNYLFFPTDKECIVISGKQLELNRRIRDIEINFDLQGKDYTAEDVINELRADKTGGKKKAISEKPGFLLDFVSRYIAENEGHRAKGSMSVYKSLRNNLESYYRQTGNKIAFSSIDATFFKNFQRYLQGLGLSDLTTSKRLSSLKTFLGYARTEGIEIKDNYRQFKISKKVGEVVTLTRDEVRTLQAYDLSNNNRLDQVRDVFIFACLTGFRYSELEALTRPQIDLKTREIKIVEIKTKQPRKVFLNNHSIEILDKYRELETPLPIISNQKFNQYLKELCNLAGINQPTEKVRFYKGQRVVSMVPKCNLIGSHTARKTYITDLFKNGMNLAQIKKATGKSSLTSLEPYAGATDDEVRAEINKGFDWLR